MWAHRAILTHETLIEVSITNQEWLQVFQGHLFCLYFYVFSIRFWSCSDSVLLFAFHFISTFSLLEFGAVPTVCYYLLFILFLRCSYQILELFRQCVIIYFSFYFHDVPIRFWSCSDSLVLFIFHFISTMFLLDFGAVPTVCYYMLFILFLRCSYQILELHCRSAIFSFHYVYIYVSDMIFPNPHLHPYLFLIIRYFRRRVCALQLLLKAKIIVHIQLFNDSQNSQPRFSNFSFISV